MSNTWRFPEYKWLQTQTYAMNVAHGISLREKGFWVIPSFQRPLVWTDEQKVKFIESLITKIPIGEYTLHANRVTNAHEVLDGQQRWNTIFEFVDNKFSVFGLFYEDFTSDEKSFFLYNLTFPVRIVSGLTEEEKLECYRRLAYGGTPHEVTS